jgi:hypothetical protein
MTKTLEFKKDILLNIKHVCKISLGEMTEEVGKSSAAAERDRQLIRN